ncbi:ATPase, T2SS/T4P/T4SS family [Paenibacillus sp. 1A_MP2]|uniref:ATPase, T2SS/T4P/T4SS family n=1 Tax=Paenibacillus sp. 1A_MP2 TaxID=3457495 RepID=UPI003FCE8F9D
MSSPLIAPKKNNFQSWDEEDRLFEKLRSNNKEVSKSSWAEWQRALLEKVLEESEAVKRAKGEVEDVTEQERKRQLERIIKDLKDIPATHHNELIQQFLNESYRYGPLQPLWDMQGVTDIQFFVPHNDGHEQIISYTQYRQRKIYNGPGFRDYEHARDWLNLHLSRIGLRFDPAKVELNGMLPGGERIHIVSGPTGFSEFDSARRDKPYQFTKAMIVSIRLFPTTFTLEELTTKSMTSHQKPFEVRSIEDVSKVYQRQVVYSPREGGIACKATMDYVRIAGVLQLSKLIAGGTGSGKTTFFNADTVNHAENEQLLIIEESPEMQPQVDGHVIRLYEREGAYTQADAGKSALRMFPSRIYFSEIRDVKVAFLFYRALMNGHRGTGSTVHAGSCAAALDITLDFITGNPEAPPRETVAKNLYGELGYIVHMDPTHSDRTIREICEVNPDGTLHTVSKFVEGIDDKGKLNGYYEFNGPSDAFVRKMLATGIEVPSTWKWRKLT